MTCFFSGSNGPEESAIQQQLRGQIYFKWYARMKTFSMRYLYVHFVDRLNRTTGIIDQCGWSVN